MAAIQHVQSRSKISPQTNQVKSVRSFPQTLWPRSTRYYSVSCATKTKKGRKANKWNEEKKSIISFNGIARFSGSMWYGLWRVETTTIAHTHTHTTHDTHTDELIPLLRMPPATQLASIVGATPPSSSSILYGYSLLFRSYFLRTASLWFFFFISSSSSACFSWRQYVIQL